MEKWGGNEKELGPRGSTAQRRRPFIFVSRAPPSRARLAFLPTKVRLREPARGRGHQGLSGALAGEASPPAASEGGGAAPWLARLLRVLPGPALPSWKRPGGRRFSLTVLAGCSFLDAPILAA